MRSVALGEIAELNPRPTRILRDNELVSFLPMAAIGEEGGGVIAEEQRRYGEVKKGYTPFNRGDLLLAKITPCFENGKVAIAEISREVGFGTTEFHVIRCDDSAVDRRYLFHFLRTPQFRDAGASRMTGAGGQRRVPVAFLGEVKVPLPPLAEQRRIADLLDKTAEIDALSRVAVAKHDELIAGVFSSLFGDLATNSKRFPIGIIDDLAAEVTYGTSQRAADGQAPWPLLRMGNIAATGRMSFDDMKYIEIEADQVERYTVHRGDILFNRTNSPELVGKTGLFELDEPMAYAGYLIRVRTNERATPEYVWGVLNSPYGKAVLRGLCKEIIGMANINATELRAIKVPLPPRALQDQFARVRQSIEIARARAVARFHKIGEMSPTLQARLFS